ncbi:MAG: hypothetical protein U5O16_42345, partial [Rhodococcus sp. (in: high G+C Gram-positive bacteria)]|nr:hypothetical protein [Rhodococcus sp. (in: high G+C Gram-positive bacteria)]
MSLIKNFVLPLISMTDETINGQPATDSIMIEEWADVGAIAYDVEKLRSAAGRPSGPPWGSSARTYGRRTARSVERARRAGTRVSLIRSDPRSSARLDPGRVKAHKSALKHGINEKAGIYA